MEPQNSSSTYPSASIDPRLKDFKYILQYVKAAWNESMGLMPGMLYFGQNRYAEIRSYGLGKQSNSKYKKILGVDEIQDNSWLNVSWEIPPFLNKYRDIGISLLLKRMFDVQAYAVDPLARSEEDLYFNQMKVKIMMREAAKKANSPLADSPLLKPADGEPVDLEQLKIQQQFGYKHVMAMEAEEAIQLIQQQNNIDEIRKRVCENLYDYGIGGYTTYIDDNGLVKFRELVPKNLILSRCTKNDFSDLVHWGEVIEVRLPDLAPFFTKEQMDDICTNVAGKWGNPKTFVPIAGGGYNRGWNRFKVMVLDFKFLTWNDLVFKEEIDNRGNKRFGKTSYLNKKFINPKQEIESDIESEEKQSIADSYNEPLSETQDFPNQGEATPKYKSVTQEVVYKTKWIVGTDYMYDYGMSENQVRKKSSWWSTSLDIQLYAWNFDEMMFAGMTEKLIPFEDDICLTWYKLQNLSNKLIPYIITLDLNSLEGLNMGKGGKNLEPSEVVDFLFNNFVSLYRSTDLLSKNPNYKPVTIEQSGQMAAFNQLYQKLNSTIDLMRQVSGLNEATDASTVNAKNLNSTNDAMLESTNNALYPMMNADKQLIYKLCDSIISKVQISVKLGKVEGYKKALGDSTVKFLKINPDIALYELGIFIEEAPTKEERMALWQDVSIKESQGLLDISDKIMVMSCRNLKQAAMLLDYKVRKNTEAQQQQKMQEIQAQGQQQIQASTQIEQMKQQTAAMIHQFEMERINAQGTWTFRTEMAKKQSDLNEAHVQAEAKVISNQLMADAKKDSAQIAAGSHLAGTHLKGQADLLMTEMDNNTKKETAASKEQAA